MKIIKTIAVFLGLMLFSCEGFEVFDDEMYEKIVYILTKEDNKVFSEVHSLEGEYSLGHVSILVSGSNPITEPISVELEYDTESMDAYNEKIFGVETDKFIEPLNPAFYEIASMTVSIDPQKEPPHALLPIKIKPEGLSPDSTYFIPLKIKSVSSDSINADHNSVLYQVYIKNSYADQQERTVYSMRGEKTEEGKTPYAILTNKTVLPLTKNKIRTTIDQVTFESNMNVINKSCMVIEIKSDYSLQITPFNSDYLDIELVEKEGYNQYRTDVAGTYRFYLSYRYRTRSSADAGWGQWYTISENLLRFVATND